MSKNKIISFSVDEIKVDSLEEINDSQFTLGRLRVFSDGMTEHRYSFTEEVLKSAEITILGKPILWAYSIWTDDASGHEKSEIPCGFIPKDKKDADITYEFDESTGKTFMYVNCYIWRVYAEKLVEILQRTDGIKDVSTELWVLEEKEHPVEKYNEVIKFAYTGVTILGEAVNPACPGANIEITKFSSNEFSKAKEIFEKQLNNSIIQEPKDGSFFDIKNESKEEKNLAKKVLKNTAPDETPEVLENAKAVTRTSLRVSQDTDVYEDDGTFVGNEYESHNKETTVVSEIPDTLEVQANATGEEITEENFCAETVENATANPVVEEVKSSNEDKDAVEVQCSILEAKCSQLETELSTVKNSFTILELKCSELQAYQDNKENELKVQAVECALNDVVDILSVDEISNWRKKSLTCSNIDAFKNELKAFAFDLQKENGTQPIETLRNLIPVIQVEESLNVWDRLAKSI